MNALADEDRAHLLRIGSGIRIDGEELRIGHTGYTKCPFCSGYETYAEQRAKRYGRK